MKALRKISPCWHRLKRFNWFEGESYTARMRAVPMELDSEEFGEVYDLYLEKYAEQSLATTMYYLMIGPRRGSQLFVLYFSKVDTP